MKKLTGDTVSIGPNLPEPLPGWEKAARGEGRKRLRAQRRRMVTALALAGLTGVSAAAAAALSSFTLCYAVTAGGDTVAYVRREDACAQAVETVEDRVSRILDTDYAYPRATGTALAIAPRQEVRTREELTTALMDTVDQVEPHYVLTVDGVSAGSCGTREAVDQALWQAQASYTTGDTVSVCLGSAVEVSQEYFPARTPSMAAAELKTRLISLAETPSARPEGGPVLEVRTVDEETYTQPIPAPVTERDDGSLPAGERVTVQTGSPGLAQCTDRVLRRCGAEESREQLSRQVVTPPTPTVVAVGTAGGVEGAQGQFIWPCRGRITSPFGPREIFGGKGFHRGLDIALPMGEPIAAADDGVVSWSGPRSTYGNLIEVDHGNGYTTRYAHCSRLLAAVGDKVTQGQVIGEVGSTGRSTGPHCHFEIRWQNEPLDPQLCLP